MEERKPKVLVDLSLALLQNSGIPLDTRWLFKQLRQNPNIITEGLAYPSDARNLNFTTGKVLKKYEDLKYSQYLGMISNDNPAEGSYSSKYRLFRIFNRFKQIYKTFFQNTFHIQEIRKKEFNEVIYRLFFENGLASSDRKLITNSTFYMTSFYKSLLFTRMMSPIPTLTPTLDTTGFDFIIHQDSTPVKVSKGTTQIIRYHDPIPVMDPDFFANTYVNATYHYNAILKNAKLGAIYVCNSVPVEESLLQLFPQLKGRTTTIPYTISEVYKQVKDFDMLFDILSSKPSPEFKKHHGVWRSEINKYKKNPEKFAFLTEVATIEPRKNHIRALKAYNIARAKLKKQGIDLKFVIAGGIGWKCKKILSDMEPLVESGDIMLMQNLHPEELKYLYSHSSAFIFPTLKEGFGLPPVEAMLCETPVISSNIPVHKWVQGDSTFYVDPYDADDMAKTIEYVVLNRNTREMKRRINAGVKKASTYNSKSNGKKWDQLFKDIKAGKYGSIKK